MKYVLTDTSISLAINGSVYNLSVLSSFNFKSIHKLLSSGEFTESQILDLLKPPENVTGYYRVLQHGPDLLVHEIKSNTVCTLPLVRSSEHWSSADTIYRLEALPILSVHPNTDSIIYEYPEAFL